jgi:alpha-D-ribose 1-methylphosphonate 5-triphosphate diphosphatase
MMVVLRSDRVLSQGVIRSADLIIEHDTIVEVAPYGTCSDVFNFDGRMITPGFVDLHSDAVEKEIEPRPGAAFPIENALVDLDKKLAMAGITTMFHAIAFNEESLVGLRGNDAAKQLIEAIYEGNNSMLAIDNFVHARFEITSFSSVAIIKDLMQRNLVQILSFMDHTPGQGQFASLQKWKDYHVPVFDLSEKTVQDIITQQAFKKSICTDYLLELSDFAGRHSILLASHDDDTSTKIDLMEKMGITIAEFPLCLETARYAKSRGMTTGMGAPNIVRGKSQSGNISARRLVENRFCDFLCSDYHPSSMLQAVYSMIREMGIEPAEAFSYVCTAPAAIAGLDDRGDIAAGKLADLLVIEDRLVPKVVMTIKSGKTIYSGGNCLCVNEHA